MVFDIVNHTRQWCNCGDNICAIDAIFTQLTSFKYTRLSECNAWVVVMGIEGTIHERYQQQKEHPIFCIGNIETYSV